MFDPSKKIEGEDLRLYTVELVKGDIIVGSFDKDLAFKRYKELKAFADGTLQRISRERDLAGAQRLSLSVPPIL